MLMPKRVKYRRQHRQSTKGKSKGGNVVDFGQFGLQATTAARVTIVKSEAARIAMTRYMKRGGKVWIKIFPHMPYTKKPLEVRMGSGKGAWHNRQNQEHLPRSGARNYRNGLRFPKSR